MERAAVTACTPAAVIFRDGLGERRHIADPTGNETLEQLCFRDELAAVPSFEFALRERVSRLANFRHAQFGRARSVERLTDREATLAVVSERTTGVRLSELIANAEERRLGLDISAALCLIRQLVPAVATLHESARDVAHGAIGPERLIVTPDARLVVVEYVLGAALEQLRFPRERYWSELRVALPHSAGLPRFDQRADVTQIGVVALSLILGRPMRDDEYPARIADVVASTWAVGPRGGFEPLPPGLRGWLGRALQLDARTAFPSAIEAQAELDKVLGDSDYAASPESLQALLARYNMTGQPAPTSHPPTRPPLTLQPPVQPPAASVTPARGTAMPPASVTPARGTAMPAASVTPARGTAIPPASVTPARGTATQPASANVPPSGSVAAPPPRGTPKSAPVTSTPPRGTAMPGLAVATTPARGTAMPATPPRPIVAPQPIVAASPAMQFQGLSDSLTIKTPPKGVPRLPRAPKPVAFDPPPADIHDDDDDDETLSRRWPRLAAVAAVLMALVAGGAFVGRRLLMHTPAPSVTTGTLVITTNPSGAQTIVDGQSRGQTPLTLELRAGGHKIELRGAGGAKTIPVTIAAGTQVAQYIELPHAASAAGQLQLRTEPAGARVTVDGVARGTSPMTVAELSPGQHTVLLESDLGSIKQTVTIESGVTASLVVPLSAPEGVPLTGWVAVSAPVEMRLYESDRLLGTSRSDRIMVSAGRHEIDIVNDELGYRATRTVQVPAGKVASVNVEVPNGTIALNAVPWAEVWIDGEKVGETPIGNLSVAIGTHDVVFKNPDLGEQHHTATVTLRDVVRLSVDLTKK